MVPAQCIPGTLVPPIPYNASITRMLKAPAPVLEYPDWDIALKIVFYVIAMLVDLVGNSIVILIILLNRKMRTVTNLLLLNLAVSDLMVGTFCMWVHLGNKISSNWPFGSFLCKFNTFTQVMSVTASVLTLTVISVERLIAVACPFRHRWSTGVSAVIVGCIWLSAIATASPQLVVRKLYQVRWKDRTDVYCTENWPYFFKDRNCNKWQPGKYAYYLVEGVVMYFLPITIMIVAYSVIAVKLFMRRGPGVHSTTTSSVQEKAKRKVTKMLAAVLVAFFVCWTPQQIMLLYELFYTPDQTVTYTALRYIAVFIAYFNSALNPILYGGFNENFRTGFLEAFKCILIQKRNKIGTGSAVQRCTVKTPNNKHGNSNVPKAITDSLPAVNTISASRKTLTLDPVSVPARSEDANKSQT